MGYIIGLVLLLLLVPFLIMLLSGRSAGRGAVHLHDHGVTHREPSSDQPTPRSPAENRKIPPG